MTAKRNGRAAELSAPQTIEVLNKVLADAISAGVGVGFVNTAQGLILRLSRVLFDRERLLIRMVSADDTPPDNTPTVTVSPNDLIALSTAIADAQTALASVYDLATSAYKTATALGANTAGARAALNAARHHLPADDDRKHTPVE